MTELTHRERTLLSGALWAQTRYYRNLAERARSPEAIARQTLHVAEMVLLTEKLLGPYPRREGESEALRLEVQPDGVGADGHVTRQAE